MKLGKVGEVLIDSDELSISDTVLMDELSKLSILSVIAGYLKQDNIAVSGRLKSIRNLGLESLLSYILNNKKFSPREYDITISDIGDEQWPENNKIVQNFDYDRVVLFSGGIDSTAAILYYIDKGKTVAPFFVDFGQKNIEDETQQVRSVLDKLGLSHIWTKVDLKHYITIGWKEWHYIIPARNFMFVCLAASLLNIKKADVGTIVLVAHEEEIKHNNTDKSRRFYQETTALLKKWYQRDFQIMTPFFRRTKTEVLSYWKREWQDKYKLSPFDTVSCYYGKGCGCCNTCVKRAISLSVAGYSQKEVVSAVDKNPFNNDERVLDSFVERFPTYPNKRKYELLIAIQNNLSYVSDETQRFYEECSKELKNKSQRYKLRLEKVILR